MEFWVASGLSPPQTTSNHRCQLCYRSVSTSITSGPVNATREHQRRDVVSRIDSAATLLCGWGAAALLNTVWFVVGTANSLSSAQQAALCVAYELGQGLAIGVLFVSVLGSTAALAARSGRAARLVKIGLPVFLSGVLGAVLLPIDLAGAASRLAGGSDSPWVRTLVCAAAAQCVPLAVLFSQLLRGRLRLAGLFVGVALLCANYLVLVGDYPAVHLFVGLTAAALVSLCSVEVWKHARARVRRSIVVSLLTLSVLVSLIQPPSSIIAPLSHSWSHALAPYFPRAWFHGSGGGKTDSVFRPGVDGKETPPSSLRLFEQAPIVIIYSVDSMRADLLEEAYRSRLPNIHRLKDEATWFRVARSPGTQTAITLTSMMTGTYYSQQYWSLAHVPEGRGVRALFAHEDETPRFPELLSAAGVDTVQYGQAVWLLGKYGMTRGFSEERIVKPTPGKPSTKGKWSTGDDIVPLIEARVAKQGEAPLFVYFHDLDPHAPFDLGATKRPAKEAYLSEIELVDRRIGRLMDKLDQLGKSDRTMLILTADHGEAFGEHGTGFHGQNLYDEQVRVPLLVKVPGQQARVIDTPVTLMDLGPTVLDVFGLSTPPWFMGQSWVPLLSGRDVTFERPIIAEGRLKQAMVLPSGLKLIRNQHEKTFELYDLRSDPAEEHNLYDELGPAGAKEMQKLIDFFEVHRIRREGYEVPYRR